MAQVWRAGSHSDLDKDRLRRALEAHGSALTKRWKKGEVDLVVCKL